MTKVEWFNPHIWVYLDVKDAEGKPQHWQCEGGAPNTLVRNGWTKNSLKQGEEITIDYRGDETERSVWFKAK